MPVAPGPTGNPAHQSVTIRGAAYPKSTKRKASRKSNRRSGRR